MRKTPIFFFVILSFLVVRAQDKDALIRQLDQHNAATLVKNDTIALKHYLASDFLLNTSGNRISFGAERILYAIRERRNSYVRFEVVTDTVYFINKKTAISMGSETAVVGSGPLKDQVQKRRYTNVWIKRRGNWKLKARHSSLICNS